MPLPNPRESRAVLIGSAGYRNLPGLPAVTANVERLRSLLTSPDLWGLAQEHCRVLLDVENPVEVLDAVHEAATGAHDTLVVYFAGHGLRDPDTDELFLALPGSSKERLFTSVRYDDLRREIVQTAYRVPSKVVVLDCCYSGAAMKGGMGDSDSAGIADQARIEGTYLMTASASTAAALAPDGERYTAFTGEIVDVFEQGIPDGPDLLNMERLYWHVRAELESKRRPVPQQRAGNSGGMIALVRNRRGQAGRFGEAQTSAAPRMLPEIPAGFEAVLRRPPQDIAAQIDILREEGREAVAGEVLAAAATRRPTQEVAGLMDYLRRAGRSADIDQVVRAVVGGEMRHAVGVVAALREIDRPGDVGEVLRAAAREPAEEIAGLAQLLRDQGYPRDVELLLSTAIAERPAADAVIALVGALWAAGLGPEVGRMLESTAPHLNSGEMMALARALDAAGRAELSITLYMKVLETAVQQPDAEVAAVLRTARQAQRSEDADRLLPSVLKSRQTPGEYLTFATALWSADLNEDATRVVDAAAITLQDADLTTLALELRALDRADFALRLYAQAAARRPARSVIAFVDALRDSGRPVDGNRLLAQSATWAPASAAEVIVELTRLARGVDADRVLAAQAERPVADVAAVVDRLARFSLAEAAERLLTAVLGRNSATDILHFVIGLYQTEGHPYVAKAVMHLVNNVPHGVETLVTALPTLPTPAGVSVAEILKHLPAGIAVRLAKLLYQTGQRGLAATVIETCEYGSINDLVAQFKEQDWLEGAGVLFGVKENIPLRELVGQYRSLAESGQTDRAAHLLDVIALYRAAKEIPELVRTLQATVSARQADHVLRTAATQRTAQDVAAIAGVLDLATGSLRRACRHLLDYVAIRPPEEVLAIERALRHALLNQQADKLKRLAPSVYNVPPWQLRR